jgi:hypothetical protein
VRVGGREGEGEGERHAGGMLGDPAQHQAIWGSVSDRMLKLKCRCRERSHGNGCHSDCIASARCGCGAPCEGWVMGNRAQACLCTGNAAAAIRDCTAVLLLRPENRKAWQRYRAALEVCADPPVHHLMSTAFATLVDLAFHTAPAEHSPLHS